MERQSPALFKKKKKTKKLHLLFQKQDVKQNQVIMN